MVIPPVDDNYMTPAGTNLFAAEIDGRKPRVYMWTFSVQKSFLNELAGGSRVCRLAGPPPVEALQRLRERHAGCALRCHARRGHTLSASQPACCIRPRRAGRSSTRLNLKLERRFSNGFQILMAHTWAKSIDTDSAGSFGSPNLNPANFQLDKGPSDFDIRHRWVSQRRVRTAVRQG